MQIAPFAKAIRALLTCFVVVCVIELAASHFVNTHISFPSQKAGSIGFVLVGVACGGLMSWYGRFVMLGLVCCLAGDYLGVGRMFVASLTAFLLGHLAYIGAFASRGISVRRVLMVSPFIAVVVAAIAFWLFPHVPGKERIPVIAYVCVISSMLLTALGASEGRAGKLIAASAILFFISDIFVARWKYVSTESTNALFCYPLYYAACLSYGWTVWMVSRERAAEQSEASKAME
jgi:uncharacterized membrane protein YhhN